MRARWAIVAAYAAAAGANQLLWLTYAPITTDAARHYGVSEDAIGWLTQVFPLLYVTLAIPAGLALNRAFRPTLLAGAWLTALGGAIRLNDTYATALIGQILVAIAQPLLLNAVTHVASTRPEQDRPRAVAIGAAGIFAGTALALPLGPALSLSTLLVVDAALATAAAIALTAVTAGVRAERVTVPLRVEPRLAAVAFLGFGVFVALMTWLQTLLEPAGISDTQTGWMLAAMVVAGVVASALLPPPLARRHRERAFLRTAALVGATSCLILAVEPHLAPVVVVPLGVVLLGSLPVLLNRAAGGAALIWLAGNSGGLVVAVLVQAVNDHPATAFSLLAAIAALVLVFV